MRVIGGTLRGRPLRAPRGDRTRPTADRVRESVFDLLGPLAPGARVLDLFAGSGALGIEALSRGASHATFVEKRRDALRTLRANLDSLGLSGRSEVLPGDVMRSSIWSAEPFDLVLADPPYTAAADDVVRRVGPILAPGGVFVLECSSRTSVPTSETLAVWKSRRYGETQITLYLESNPEDTS